MVKRMLLFSSMIGMVLLMTGCFNIDQPITEGTDGIWDPFFVYPLSWLLTNIAEIANGSYGVAIIFVTILLRILILPLMIKQTKSTKAMQALQPQMTELREKYSAKDQQTQQKLQQEMMALFQEHKVNPLAGCFPILIQMPILIALYHAIIRTPQINPEIVGDAAATGQTFLWFELGSSDPYFILPLIAGATTFLQQRMMMVQDNPQMRMLLYIMPVMIMVFASIFPAALALYWVIGNLFMIVQTQFITGPNVGKTNEQKKNEAKEKKGKQSSNQLKTGGAKNK
ncbi:YidC family membrane integrase SpoIIIJ [Salisediminibacterium halotolerans]|uniref:YidC family membrane integrase SpoIIIJ n=1 Tax=Salisediminibacterium halotolerans TaxID=517425 RepID=UPI000F1E4F58|nr:YidC family membrane integrase SpoIIIJ [Salisediminibacterium halotolerans]RLJ69734.1 protein translocase subunit yidC [Actinophytocola xinjiangensis]RPE89792.1 protein translocase subunit yidC [Salisediminibacterium halotolerans]TWG32628.1 protein translocase subunit yidC [Salisediminibacterium halotolerans]GEL07560.1 membrane protein insertase MisCA [Salisediminibacterium halotolerans]